MRPLEDFLDTPAFTLVIGSDHGGFEVKAHLIDHLRAKGVTVDDVGPCQLNPADDYPDFAGIVGRQIAAGEADCGILICRAGIGMSINANRFHHVRAALVLNEKMARVSRDHNCSNVLVTGGDGMALEQVCAIVDAWLSTPYSGEGRHTRRLEKIEQNSYDPIFAVRDEDPEIARLLDLEQDRQNEKLEMIASENTCSPAVRAAQGSSLTDKYAEGYPGKRYYGGCEFVDEVETLAIERAKELFGAEAVNVQPHSGSQANMAAYFALLEPGAKILAMDLAHGGHLTHGMHLNFSGRLFDFVSYGVEKETERLDYDKIAALALEHHPQMLLAGASAYPRIFDFERLRAIADSVGAYLMVDMAHIAGLVAAGVHPSPVPFADVVTTTTHKTLRGPRGGMVLCREKYIKKINSQVFPGLQGGPLMHVIAAKAICFKEALQDEFKAYQRQVVANATALAEALQEHGFRIVSGGTDNHLMLVDMRSKGTTGKLAELALDHAGITANKNLIPFDPEKPFVTSGVRLGTPAVTTRGMKEPQMRQIAGWIDRIVSSVDDVSVQEEVRGEVSELTSRFRLPTF